MVVDINQVTDVKSEVSSLIIELGYVGTVLTYIGTAAPGSLTSEAVWFIEKLEYDGSDNLVRKIKANGLNVFNSIFDNRALLSYS